MARGINKWIGIGNVCADPVTKCMPNGGAVCNITVASGDDYKDKATGEKVDRTEFVKVVMFNKLAEISAKYLTKGAKVYIEGAMRTRKWQDKNGVDKYMTEIVASEMQMIDSKPSQESYASGGAAPAKKPAKPAQENQETDEDNDIPF
jgi:single-strand DNA-binding protein